MAEPSRYVSLRDLLEKEPPKHMFTYHSESRATDDEDDDCEEDFSLRSVMMRKPASPPQPKSSSDVPGQVSRADPVTCNDEADKIVEKDRKRHTDEASKSITRSAPFSASMRHSRSDEPLVYMGRRDEDDFDAFDSAEDLKTASRRLMNFSWEEMNLKSSVFSDSDDN